MNFLAEPNEIKGFSFNIYRGQASEIVGFRQSLRTNERVANAKEREMSDLPYNEWCHVYAQYAQHSEAKIEGTREALESIRDAVDAALKSGRQGRTKTLFTSDGEGYRVTVDVRTLGYLEEQPLPYMACWAGGLGQSYHNTENELKERTRQMVERHNAERAAAQAAVR